MKVLFTIAFVLCSSAFAICQEVKWKIETTPIENGKVKFDVTLTQQLSEADCLALKQAFENKEQVTVLVIEPANKIISIKGTKSVRATDVKDIIEMAGFEVAKEITNPQSNR